MKKVKKILIILSLISIVTLTLILLPNGNNILKTNNKTMILNNKNIALMIEQKNGEYSESTNNTWPDKEKYIFNPNLSKCDKGGKLSYDESKNVVNVKSTKTEKCYLYFDEYNYENYCKYSNDNTMVCDILRKKDNTIIYHDGLADYDGEENVSLEADDLSYRYAGESVNNYICFGSKNCSSVATNDNYQYLYRIVGFFKNDAGKYEAKLIKADYSTANELGEIGAYEEVGVYLGNEQYLGDKVNYYPKVVSYYWSYKEDNPNLSVNDWNLSDLYNINLNDYYLNTYLKKKDDIEWKDLITTHNWITAGNTNSNLLYASTVRKTFDNEIKDTIVGDILPNATKSVNAKIGLLYISDYFYGSSPLNWNIGSNNKKGANNWIYFGLCEWLITRNASVAGSEFYIYNDGRAVESVDADKNAVRPVFYLKDTVKIVSGNGSKTSPYIIN